MRHIHLECHLEINRLRREETQLTQTLSAIRTRLNALLPISQLPTELLLEIFIICVSWLYTPHGHNIKRIQHPLAFTQVSRTWRLASLSSPHLWSKIDLSNPLFASYFLQRSKKVPLSLTSSLPPKLDVDMLAPHAHRLSSIDLFLFPDDMETLFTSIGPCLSKSVTELSLKVPPVSCCIALNLSFPNVRKLTLDCVSIHWESIQNLTHLSLRIPVPEFCPSLPQLLAIFEKSPYMTYVRLENISPALPSPSLISQNQKTIHLPRLKELTISSPPLPISSLLSALTLSPHARIQLFSRLPPNADLHTLFPLGGLPFSSPGPTISTIRLARYAMYLLRPNAPAWSDTPANVAFSLSSSLPVAIPTVNSLHRNILPLRLVTSLELATGVLIDLHRDELQRFFWSLVGLEELRIAFNDLTDILSCLSSSPSSSSSISSPFVSFSHDDEDGDTPPPKIPCACPNLNSLTFNKPSDLWWHFRVNWLSLVLKCAKARKNHRVGSEFDFVLYRHAPALRMIVALWTSSKTPSNQIASKPIETL
ncbi:uncharacterized protein LACBIDRAFT_293289 [Laccaria bicolor S238N-H82]|uniref:Predicted protein n=1 Tax=Laccaria bicolor (strain S238N-H82 / ATCC MYA-4686) TaxID=486041 RepID=B0D2P8_LACBS|nr:uncharacterized protein LACBIDRAFT_293289 [Laccaria bicolor S238N-H82]EDR10790.1 predicted protein [Laccaria bicolor S238N-H82]|eukprot:XP_001878091.1 predicted protein [Laccaria bicolor S238N-H82]